MQCYRKAMRIPYSTLTICHERRGEGTAVAGHQAEVLLLTVSRHDSLKKMVRQKAGRRRPKRGKPRSSSTFRIRSHQRPISGYVKLQSSDCNPVIEFSIPGYGIENCKPGIPFRDGAHRLVVILISLIDLFHAYDVV